MSWLLLKLSMRKEYETKEACLGSCFYSVVFCSMFQKKMINLAF